MKVLQVHGSDGKSRFENTDTRTHDYSIEANGVLTVWAEEKASTVISVPEEKTIVVQYSPFEWQQVEFLSH